MAAYSFHNCYESCLWSWKFFRKLQKYMYKHIGRLFLHPLRRGYWRKSTNGQKGKPEQIFLCDLRNSTLELVSCTFIEASKNFIFIFVVNKACKLKNRWLSKRKYFLEIRMTRIIIMNRNLVSAVYVNVQLRIANSHAKYVVNIKQIA